MNYIIDKNLDIPIGSVIIADNNYIGVVEKKDFIRILVKTNTFDLIDEKSYKVITNESEIHERTSEYISTPLVIMGHDSYTETHFIGNLKFGINVNRKLFYEFQDERRNSDQLTLGRLIEKLEKMNQDLIVDSVIHHSNRGYNVDLGFETELRKKIKISKLLKICKDCVEKAFESYKGSFWHIMDLNTPIWISYIGSSGKPLVGIDENDGTFITKDFDI